MLFAGFKRWPEAENAAPGNYLVRLIVVSCGIAAVVWNGFRLALEA